MAGGFRELGRLAGTPASIPEQLPAALRQSPVPHPAGRRPGRAQRLDRGGEHRALLRSRPRSSSSTRRVGRRFKRPSSTDAMFRDVSFRGSWSVPAQRRIFLVAEALVLVVAMVLAVMRSLPGPGLRPAADLSIGLHRPVPRHPDDPGDLRRSASACPRSSSRGCPTSEVFWAIVALVLVYSAYVAEVYRAGHRVGASEPDGGRPVARALRGCRRCATSCCPRRSGACIPPLLNDFIGLQKDSALVAFARGDRGAATASIDLRGASFNFTPFVVAGAGLPRDHDPAGAVRRLADRARPAAPPGRMRAL